MTTPVDSDDRALVSAFVSRRDERAFRSLYGRHSPGLFRFALRVCGGNQREAEDILQDTWVAAAGALSRFRWQSSLRTWLTGIALNCYRQMVRSSIQLAREELTEDTPAPVSHTRGERVDLERALARLPERYRTVLVLHDIEGYTHEEIGDMLGIDTGTSKSQLFRGRRRMREMLDPASGGKEATNA